jgi:predicted phage terminase large subunit-like protein
MGFKESGDSWVVGQVWCAKDAGRYLVHQVRGHWGFTTTLEAMKALGMAYPQTMGLVLIEDKANGPALMDVLRRSVPGLIAVEPAGSKLARALSVQGTIEAGNVWLPHHAPWVPGYIKECGLFPSATHDDQVDTTSQALQRMNNQPRFHIGVL